MRQARFSFPNSTFTALIFTSFLARTACLIVLAFSVSVAGQDSNANANPLNISEEAGKEAQAREIKERNEFLQENFPKFTPMAFIRTTNSQAAIQAFPREATILEHRGNFYCGFRFEMPEWLDGDFDWFYLCTATKGAKDQIKADSGHIISWFIVPEQGSSRGFTYRMRGGVKRYPTLKTKFPNKSILITQDLDRRHLEPGKSYAIWFRMSDQKCPDLVFSMTIRSERGEKEFGILPLN